MLESLDNQLGSSPWSGASGVSSHLRSSSCTTNGRPSSHAIRSGDLRQLAATASGILVATLCIVEAGHSTRHSWFPSPWREWSAVEPPATSLQHLIEFAKSVYNRCHFSQSQEKRLKAHELEKTCSRDTHRSRHARPNLSTAKRRHTARSIFGAVPHDGWSMGDFCAAIREIEINPVHVNG